MKKFLGILVLSLFLITPSWADDISDFQIEGMSIGDSLLDYVTKDEIENKEKVYHYATKDYYQIGIKNNLNVYDIVTLHLKTNDKRYKIENISGVIEFKYKNEQAKKKCESSMNEIANSIKEGFNLVKKDDVGKLSWDKTGKSTYKRSNFKYKNGYPLTVICQYWHETTPFSYLLKTTISSEEFLNYLSTKAY